jgi:enoyl-CoA hydratase
MATDSEDFEVEWKDECAYLKLTRPAKRNAITVAILGGLEACCDALDAGEGRALIVTGEGDRAFCSGTDLGESATLGLEAGRAKGDRARDLFVRLYRSPWTSIAALNGLAYGGGLELALACTFRVAVAGVRLSLPEIKLGVLPAYGGTQFLPPVVGRARALDLMMTGRAVTAEEALAMSLVDRVVPDLPALMPASREFAQSILAHSQFALDRLRRCVDAASFEVSDAGLAVEAKAVIEAMDSEDAKEGVVAFLKKRDPIFKHR